MVYTMEETKRDVAKFVDHIREKQKIYIHEWQYPFAKQFIENDKNLIIVDKKRKIK